MKKNFFLDFIDSFIHEDVKSSASDIDSSEELRKSRLIVGFGAALFPLIFIMFISRYIAEYSQSGQVNVTIYILPVAAMIMLLNIYLIKKHKQHILSGLIIAVLTLIIVPMRAYMTGGMNSTVITWYCIIPIWCGMVIGARAALISALISAVQLIFISYPSLLGLQPHQLELVPMAQYIVAIICIFSITALIIIYENQRNSYHTNLLDQSLLIEAGRHQADKLNQLLKTMLNSVGQGFLIFDQNGDCLTTYSKACESLLESSPAGEKIWDVLKINDSDIQSFNMWLDLVFKAKHDFSKYRELGPQSFINSKQQTVRLEYFPVMDGASLQSIVMVATDVTTELQALDQAKHDREHANMILKMTRNSYAFARFNRAFELMLQQFEIEFKNIDKGIDKLFRIIHTIKGTAATLSMLDIATFSHSLETVLSEFNTQSKDDQVTAQKEIEDLLSKMRESHKNIMTEFQTIMGNQASSGRNTRQFDADQLRSFYKVLSSENTSEKILDQYSRIFIKEPIGHFFLLYQELVQDLADQLSKKVKPLKIIGGDLLIDAEPYIPLFESFVHIFRNSMDHGFELPEVRQSLNKDREGQIIVNISNEQNGGDKFLRIAVSDDGCGIDEARIARILKASGRANEVIGKTKDELIQMVFSANFSTKSTLTDISGRGIGLDAVLAEAKKLGGSARAESVTGKETRIIIEVPLAVTI